MRIIEEDTESSADLIEIKSAVYIGDFAIRLIFSDGLNRLVDFKPFLESSIHPSIRKYLDEKMFQEFSLVDGNLNWNDYDLIFPLEDLHAGQL